MARLERAFAATVMRALRRLRASVTRDVGDDPAVMLARLADDEYTRPFQDAIARQLQAVALAGADFGREQIETGVYGVKAVEVGMWELANNAAAQWALQYSYELVRGLIRTTRDRIADEIEQYVLNSETIGQLMQQIAAGSGFSEQRAMMIAVTEVTRAFAQGSLESWRASGVTQGKRWNTNNDEIVAACPICAPLHRMVVPLDAEFPGGLFAPPGHPRCRCWLSPVPVMEV